MESADTPVLETELGDPLDPAVNCLPTGSPDELIQRVLSGYGVAEGGAVDEVRKRLSTLEQPQLLPTSQALDLIVEVSEKALTVSMGNRIRPRDPGLRFGYCGLASDITAVVAEQLGFKADIFQMTELNSMRGVPVESSFQHVFTILTDQNRSPFLMDLSFCQFIDPETGQVRQVNHPELKNPVDSEFADQFIWPGYAPLSDESLNKYLRLSSHNSAAAGELQIEKVMNHAKRNELDHSRTETLAFVDLDFLKQRTQEASATNRSPNHSPLKS